MLKVRSEACAFIACKNAIQIRGIPPPEVVIIFLSQPLCPVIFSKQKLIIFDDMPRMMCSCNVQPFVCWSAVEWIDRQTVISAAPIILTNKLFVKILVTPAENGVKLNIVYFIFFTDSQPASTERAVLFGSFFQITALPLRFGC